MSYDLELLRRVERLEQHLGLGGLEACSSAEMFLWKMANRLLEELDESGGSGIGISNGPQSVKVLGQMADGSGVDVVLTAKLKE